MKPAVTGFSLIELMISVAIVAILATVAYPSYTSYVLESRRGESWEALAEVSLLQEQYYLDNGSYATTLVALGLAASGETSFSTDNGHYSVTLSAASADAFTVTATAQGVQLNDKSCKSISYSSIGAKTAVDSEGSSSNECW
ncbi:type IV pilin protein [Aliagarivorans taiwanensis]|uniref:type IV pilin protein n=1 Tax=Aliagarivorans taiwanensis TaxID=561966 RepID=UPI0003F6D0FE|nr:type IV pilin protein [Aliagarivorans taiwanensis]